MNENIFSKKEIICKILNDADTSKDYKFITELSTYIDNLTDILCEDIYTYINICVNTNKNNAIFNTYRVNLKMDTVPNKYINIVTCLNNTFFMLVDKNLFKIFVDMKKLISINGIIIFSFWDEKKYIDKYYKKRLSKSDIFRLLKKFNFDILDICEIKKCVFCTCI
jgi:hypothetical protein